MSESQLRDLLVVLLAGRAAERLVYQETTIGAENDLERASYIARRMVMSWGMSRKLGPVSYKLADDDPFLGRELHQQRQFSEHTLELIDADVAEILSAAEQQATAMLQQRRAELERLARTLLEEEELDDDQIRELIGPSVHRRADAAGP
jgi:cell division protease FtsH